MKKKIGKYNYKISNLRALAILVVVFGHSIIIFDTSWNYYTAVYSSPLLENVKHFINLFQMPLFVFISGYCFFYSNEKLSETTLGTFIKNKAKRLLIPFIGFALLWMIPIRLLSKYPYWKGLSLMQIILQVFSGKDSGHLWFCPALFLIMLIACFLEIFLIRKNNSHKALLPGMIAFLYLISISSPLFPSVFFIRDVAKYMVWFYLGYYVNYLSKDSSRFTPIMLIAAVMIMCPSALGMLDKAGIIKLGIDYFGTTLFILALFFLAPAKRIGSAEAISKNSFGVYLFHSPMIYVVFCYFSYLRPAVMVLITFAVLFTVAFLLTNMIRHLRIGKALIGE